MLRINNTDRIIGQINKNSIRSKFDNLASLSSKHENVFIIGNFKAQVSDASVKDFCDIYSFKHLKKKARCYKTPINPKCIDLMLTNRQRNFQNFCVIKTGLCDFHQMTVTVLRSYFLKAEPKIIMYRNYKKISNNEFRSIINTKNENLWNSFDTFTIPLRDLL